MGGSTWTRVPLDEQDIRGRAGAVLDHDQDDAADFWCPAHAARIIATLVEARGLDVGDAWGHGGGIFLARVPGAMRLALELSPGPRDVAMVVLDLLDASSAQEALEALLRSARARASAPVPPRKARPSDPEEAILERLAQSDVVGPVLYHALAIDLAMSPALAMEACAILAARGVVRLSGRYGAHVDLVMKSVRRQEV